MLVLDALGVLYGGVLVDVEHYGVVLAVNEYGLGVVAELEEESQDIRAAFLDARNPADGRYLVRYVEREHTVHFFAVAVGKERRNSCQDKETSEFHYKGTLLSQFRLIVLFGSTILSFVVRVL